MADFIEDFLSQRTDGDKELKDLRLYLECMGQFGKVPLRCFRVLMGWERETSGNRCAHRRLGSV